MVIVTESLFPALAVTVDVTFEMDKSNVSGLSTKLSFKIITVTLTVELSVAPTLKVAMKGTA